MTPAEEVRAILNAHPELIDEAIEFLEKLQAKQNTNQAGE